MKSEKNIEINQTVFVVLRRKKDVIVRPMTKSEWTAMALTGKGLKDGEHIEQSFEKEHDASHLRDYLQNLFFGSGKN